MPAGPIRLLVGFAPGGANDAIARLISTPLQNQTKTTVVVENKPGVGSNVAAGEMARATPNGQVLLLGSTGGQTIAPAIYAGKLPFDPAKDIQPVTLISRSALAVVVHDGLPVKNISELIAYAKQNPGKLNYSTGGSGTGAHLGTEYFKSMAGVSITHIPYKGDAPALQDVMAGLAHVNFAGLPAAIAATASGKVRIIAVTSPKRVPQLPNIPTVAESGLPDYSVLTWYGVFTTGGTPAPVVKRLATEIGQVVNQPAVRESIVKLGMEPAPSTPEEFAKLFQADMDRWGRMVRTLGIKAD
ncbi:tripartite tricarboxylate transporter substrate binding protein [Ramlibacter sp. GTP1]|uniref:Tripartite tricarboxylate transporter substrate binding protein n=2 Tax=Ramlibacter albus TaxID=2079448 RepID=A0A923S766_9BURK|nr:tripartite tricarboxylate transporter substrate binding protein [Ramlibacter albus]MBC5766852.1 tripartite tricarboxylate transporter substrate binding protein [Ramlibacter albus]